MDSQEKIDWPGCPLVEVKPGVLSGAPVLHGTRMPVSAIVDNFDFGVSVAEIAEQFEVPPDRIEAILNYAKSQRLARAAEQTRFDVIVTSDQNIRYQQNLTGRKLALVVLGSNIWPVVRD
jgi:uncharacterized protein (DUF433 family)